ncbi:trypsin-3-like [Parasteatoda tepidariorum]|uniref:trypsin-3-like n=1 Tax=Parasteatoda tepidariorum TaxID=114398 RepID=UPI001C71B368|nr:trypsin I-P1-like [Parasteatoda tepidariorum]
MFLTIWFQYFHFMGIYAKTVFPVADKRELCPCGSNGSFKQTRVVGGHNAARGLFPYASCLVDDFQAREEKEGYHQFCGATLITDIHAVTAAHCLKSRQAEEVLVDVGDYAIHSSPQGQLRKIRSIKSHPSYTPGKFFHDIAVIEFEEPVQWDSGIRTVWLPSPNLNLKPGTIVNLYGWGRLNYSGISADSLQSVELPVVSNEKCQSKFKTEIQSNMMCAGGEGGRDACTGDSGSGLVVRLNDEYVLCGLVSFGRRCALPEVAGVYTRVSSFVKWIYKNTLSAHCKPCIME